MGTFELLPHETASALDFDTEKEFRTVNGITAHGGSLDGAGPIIVDGIVYVNSRYPGFGARSEMFCSRSPPGDKKGE